MPSDGANCPKKHSDLWLKFAEDNDAKFSYVDNSKIGEAAQIEKEKVEEANILVLSGGNTFTLMRNLRRSGLPST